MRVFRNWLHKESGQSVIFVALALVVLCGFAALGVDIGVQATNQGQLQNAADAAALAAARELPSASTAQNTAAHYAEINGVVPGRTTSTTPYKGNANRIEVVCKETVQYSFARIFGLKSTEITARAVAEKTGMTGGPFGYALFSGGTSNSLELYTSSLYVGGSAHSNNAFIMNGSTQTITGNAEAVKTYTSYGSVVTIGGVCQAASFAIGDNLNIPNRLATAAAIITMPDFSADAQAEASKSGVTYTGDKQFVGSSINVDQSVYVDGSILVSGSSFKGQGILLAKNDIQFNGSMIASASSSSVCVYSKTGNIQINGSSIEVGGILYAPNGMVQINGSSITVKGRIIAKTVQLNGSDIKVISGANDLACLPGGGVTLVE